MGLYRYYDPKIGKRRPLKSVAIVNSDGTNEYTPDQIKAIEDDLVAHKAEKATQDGYGHVRLQDIPNPEVATQAEAEVGTNNTKMMTPLRVHQAIDNKVRIVDNDLLEMNICGELKLFSLTPVAFIDNSNSPGSKYAIAGDWNAGFFGEVPMSELITGDALATKIGLSAGTSQFSDTAGWLKFAYNGKIQFVAKKPLRYGVTWNDIDAVNAVYGDRTIVIDGLTYKVRLMRGALTDPSKYDDPDRGAKGSEWNRLMLPIHIEAKDKSWAHPAYVEDDIPYWGIYFTDKDLITHYNSGCGDRSWCQETTGNTSSSRRVYRGNVGVSDSRSDIASYLHNSYGWRPVLELIF